MIVRGNEPIIIVRKGAATGEDDYGNAVRSSQEILIRDGLFAYTGSSDTKQVASNPVDVKLTLYLPKGTEIQDGDLFEIRGKLWEKDGSPEEWQQLWAGFTPGVVVQVRQHRG